MPVPVQVIFQGGGAKLVTLLAAAEVLEELEAENQIKITQVAGTSAGAIVAYLVACKTPIREFRGKIVAASKDRLGHFSKKLSKLKLAYKVAFGQPIFEEEILRSFILDVIGEEVGDIKIPAYARAADVYDSELITYRLDNQTKESAARQLTDSCAIPFAFRTYSTNSTILDGGIGSNLVDQNIFEDPIDNILAFSFDKQSQNSSNDLVSYCKAITSTMIDNSVREASEKILLNGGYVCELPNRFETFDFSGALEKGLNNQFYKETKELVSSKIDKAMEHFQQINIKQTDAARLESISNLFKNVHASLLENHPIKIESSSMICICNCLHESGNKRRSLPDELIKVVEFTPINESIAAFKIGITRDENESSASDDLNIIVTDKDGNFLDVHYEAFLSGDGNEASWFSYCVLKEKITTDRCPIHVVQTSRHIGLMKDLNNFNASWLRIPTISEKFDIVLGVPASFPKIVMTDLLENKHRIDHLPFKPFDLQTMGDKWNKGSTMNEQELTKYRQYANIIPNCQLYGWSGKNLISSNYLGTLVERVEG